MGEVYALTTSGVQDRDALAFYFGSNPGQRIVEDRDELRTAFDPWRQRVRLWDRLIYPVLTNNSPATNLVASKTELEQQARARYISNEIRTGCDTLINRFEKGSPIFEVGLSTSPDKEQQVQTALVERFLHGVVNSMNQAVVDSRMGAGWEHQVYSFATFPSKAIGFSHFLDTGEFKCDLYDPINCYYDIGPHPLRFIHEVILPAKAAVIFLEENKIAVPAELGKKAREKPNDGVTITKHYLNWWAGGQYALWFSVLVDDVLVGGPRKTAFKRDPITVVSMNTMGRTYQDVGMGEIFKGAIAPNYLLRLAEPWFASVEHTVGQYEEGKSLEMLEWGLTVRPVRLLQSKNGNAWRDVRKDRLNTPGETIEVTDDMIVREVLHQQHPMGENTIMKSLEGNFKNAFPDGLRAGVPFAGASGHFLNILIDQSEVTMTPFTLGAATFIGAVAQELLQQFREANGKVSLIVRDRQGSARAYGRSHYEDFSAADIPDGTVIKVRLAPMMPHDDLRTTNVFIQTTSSGMYSKRNAMTRANVEDPVGEMALVYQEQAEANPINQQRRALKAARDELKGIEMEWKKAQRDGNDELAMELEVDLAVQTLQYDALEAKLLGGPLPPFQQAGPQGIGPETQPPEEGPNNPDQAADAQGRAPYMGGRPVTPLSAENPR